MILGFPEVDMPMIALGLALLITLPAPAAQTAAGGVTGRVLDAATKQPVAGAQVSLMPEGRPPSGPFAPPTAETDAKGVYRFTNLDPGRYRIMVRRAGYAVQDLPPARPPVVQAVAGQAQTAPDLLLNRGGVIAGRVMDPTGQPLVEARVTAMRQMPAGRGGARNLMPVGSGAQTNDLGEFRLYGLPAGDYYVQLVPRPESGPMGPFSSAPRETATAATFYPGTADAAGAHAISLGAGQTVQDVVFSAVVVPVFQVSGIVVDESGAPVADAMVMLMPDMSSGARSFGPPARARADREGRFRVVNVPNGAYMANAAVPVVISSDAGRGSAGGAWASGVSAGVSGGIGGSSVMVESRNGTTVQYRNDNSAQVRVAVQDGHVADVRLMVRRQQ